jgi:CheY-like chemotaxis protein
METPMAVRRPILVINHDQQVLALVRELLEDAGYRVATDRLDDATLDRVKLLMPDLIVVDVVVDGQERGWPFVEQLKRDPSTAAIPVVLCTSAAQTASELGANLAALAIDVVLKPFAIDELVARVSGRLTVGERRVDD